MTFIDYQVLLYKDWHVCDIQNNSLVKINFYLLNNNDLVVRDVTILF